MKISECKAKQNQTCYHSIKQFCPRGSKFNYHTNGELLSCDKFKPMNYQPTDETIEEPPPGPMNKELKIDEGKPNWSILPFEAIEFIIPAFEVGLKKYGGPFTYRGGINFSELYAAAMRHLTSWYLGEDIATDSNVHHLAHAMANILMIVSVLKRHNGKYDDRVKV